MAEKKISPEAKRMGARLRKLRDDLDKTQAEVAAAFGIGEGGYAAYETGRSRLVATDLPKMAQALGVPLAMLTRRLGLLGDAGPQNESDVEDRMVQMAGDADIGIGLAYVGRNWQELDESDQAVIKAAVNGARAHRLRAEAEQRRTEQ